MGLFLRETPGLQKPPPRQYSCLHENQRRNSFPGTITAITTGPVSPEVTIRAPKLEIVSVTTSQSARRLSPKVGQKAYPIVKSDSVMVGTN
jgi:molybdopterin-binding protein